VTKTVIVAISDLHVGSSTGLCPAAGIAGPDGTKHMPSKFQEFLWECWTHFFKTEFERICKKVKKTVLVVNGDLVDGSHHNTINLMTNSIQCQERAAADLLKEVAGKFSRVYVVRGTEAHVQPGAQSDERIGELIGAEKDEGGDYSRWQLWLDGSGVLFQFAHHIGTTSSAAYESSAPMRELVAGLVEAAQWGSKLPQVMVRSHRHRFIPVAIPSESGRIQIVITPAWQLRTPFVERIDRMRLPHIGGVFFIVEDNECQVKEKLYRLPLPQVASL
jgi:hypothetical protein